MIGPMLSRHGPEHLGLSFRFAVSVLKPPLTVFTRRDWQGRSGFARSIRPATAFVATNHLSWFDPLPMAHLLWDNGRPPRFLGKESVFKVPLVGQLLLNCGQIPVYRDTDGAADSVRAAVAAVEAGEAVVVYPEGTITRDPELWPMSAKTGRPALHFWATSRWFRWHSGVHNESCALTSRSSTCCRRRPCTCGWGLRWTSTICGSRDQRRPLAQATDRIMDAVTEQGLSTSEESPRRRNVWTFGPGARRTPQREQRMPRIAVMGSGSAGTGFGMVLADAGGDVAMWAREPEVVEDINHRHVNSLYHEGIELPPTMWASQSVSEVLRGAEIVVLAIPSQTLRDNPSAWKEEINPDATLVSLMKGIELGTVMRMSEVIAEVTGFPVRRSRWCRVPTCP